MNSNQKTMDSKMTPKECFTKIATEHDPFLLELSFHITLNSDAEWRLHYKSFMLAPVYVTGSTVEEVYEAAIKKIAKKSKLSFWDYNDI